MMRTFNNPVLRYHYFCCNSGSGISSRGGGTPNTTKKQQPRHECAVLYIVPAGDVGGDAPEVWGEGADAKVAEGDVEQVGHHHVVCLEAGRPELEVLVTARSNAYAMNKSMGQQNTHTHI